MTRAIGHGVHDRWSRGKRRSARGQQDDRCNQLLHVSLQLIE
jgi:hypothetical protein